METITVYYENCTEHDTQTVWSQGGVSNVTAGGLHVYRSALKGNGTVTEQQQSANMYC
jgi:hypothetical protein